MGYINRQWAVYLSIYGLKIGWTNRSRCLWSVVQSTVGGKTIVVYPRGWCWTQYCFLSSLMTCGIGHPQQVYRRVQNSDEHQMVVLPFKETWTDWGTGKRGIVCISTRANEKSSTLGGINPCTYICWGLTIWKACLWKTLESCGLP